MRAIVQEVDLTPFRVVITVRYATDYDDDGSEACTVLNGNYPTITFNRKNTIRYGVVVHEALHAIRDALAHLGVDMGFDGNDEVLPYCTVLYRTVPYCTVLYRICGRRDTEIL